MAKKYPSWIKVSRHKMMYDYLDRAGKKKLTSYVRKSKLKRYLQLKKELKI